MSEGLKLKSVIVKSDCDDILKGGGLSNFL